jgi:hypothetical protein
MSVSRVCRNLAGAVLWLAMAAPLSAATVTLAWDANSPGDSVTNYNVAISTQPSFAGAGAAVGNRTTWTFTGLQANVQYYFSVQAQSAAGLSPWSQVGYFTPPANSAGSEPSRSDFNGDGKFDVLWQNQASGQLLAWHMNGASVTSSQFLNPSAVGLDWKLRGSGDFNGDGKPDLVWQNTKTGDVNFYMMDGVTAFATGSFSPDKVDPTWQIASVRDIDGDGNPDILWNNVNTGQVLCWYMNGTTMARMGWINANALGDVNWKLRGTGDFTYDGIPDLVWQHELSGQILLWVMNGANATAAINMPSPGVGVWKIRAVGDANLDGSPDLIFENSDTGGVVIWAMQGTSVSSGPYIATVDPTWVISAPR